MATAQESKAIQKARKKVKQQLQSEHKKMRSKLLKSISFHLRTDLQHALDKRDLLLFEKSLHLCKKKSLPIESPSPFITQLKKKISQELASEKKIKTDLAR